MRKENWPSLLTQGIEDWKEAQFYWGKADCVHFAAMIAASFIDIDIIAALGGIRKFETEAQAMEYFVSEFDSKIENIFDQAFVRHATPTYARRGDIVIVDANGQDAAGIVADGGTLVACKSKAGFVYIPASAIKIAWVTE